MPYLNVKQRVERINRVMLATGCTQEQARAELDAEGWDFFDAVLNLKHELGLRTVCIKLGENSHAKH